MKPSMQALVLTRPRHYELIELPIPQIQEGQVLIRLRCAMLCGSDRPLILGTRPWDPVPLVPGRPIHECVGEVVDSRISNLLPGTWVVTAPKNKEGLAEYIVGSAGNVAPLYGWDVSKGALSPDLAVAVVCQPTATVLYSLSCLRSPMLFKQTALITGLGAIGMIFCILLREMGIEHIIGIEPNSQRRRWAEDWFGVQTYPAWSDDLNNCADLAIEAAGHEDQPQTLAMCIHATRRHGQVIMFGETDTPELTLPAYELQHKNLALLGTIEADLSIYLPRAVRVVLDHKDDFKKLLTHRYPWKEAQTAYEFFLNPESPRLKILLEVDPQ